MAETSLEYLIHAQLSNKHTGYKICQMSKNHKGLNFSLKLISEHNVYKNRFKNVDHVRCQGNIFEHHWSRYALPPWLSGMAVCTLTLLSSLLILIQVFIMTTQRLLHTTKKVTSDTTRPMKRLQSLPATSWRPGH